MSVSATDRDLEMLAWLAERDMAAVAHAHEQLLAATEPEAVATLGRNYQRMSRALRTTLVVKMKAQKTRLEEDERAQMLARHGLAASPGPKADLLREQRLERRTMELQGAVERVAAAVIPDPQAREDHLLRFDQELDRWLEAPDFLTADLDELVLRACRLMGLPEDLARAWRKLPKVVYDRPADDAPPNAAPPPSSRRDSG